MLNGAGIFCTTNTGNIVNCRNSARVYYSSSSSEGIRAAGICNENYGNIMNCVNEGNIELELIAIYGSWSKAVTTCGGICAVSGHGSSIVNCTNTGIISNKGIYYSVTGGIVGNAQNGRILGCTNKGTVHSYVRASSPSDGLVNVQSYQHQQAGGIAGYAMYCVINRCKNHGTVKSNYEYLGGIAGYVGNSDVYNLENYGDVEGYEGYGFHAAAGIIPYLHNPYKRQYFLNCINHGAISAFSKYGIATSSGIGSDIENAYIANCYSLGSVSSMNTGNMSAGFEIPQYQCENCEQQGVRPLIRHLAPGCDYRYEILSADEMQVLDRGKFTTMTPVIEFASTSVGYDNIEYTHSCDAKGADDIDAFLFFGETGKEAQERLVAGSTISVEDLDEETSYTAELAYCVNGKEFRSKIINVTTKAIIPQFSLVSSTTSSLTLKCDNFEELQKFNPVLHIEKPKYYCIGGYRIGESRDFKPDSEGVLTVDSLMYNDV